MGASEVGAAWWQQRLDKDKNPVLKDGKPIWNLSIKLEFPFLGEISLTAVPNEDERKSDKAPVFKILWWPPRKDQGSRGAGGPPPAGWPSGAQGDRDPNTDDGPGY